MTDLFKKHGYIAYPEGIIVFANELKTILDDYQERKLSNEEIEEIILFYIENDSDKLFTGDEINITVKRTLAKRKTGVLENILKNLAY